MVFSQINEKSLTFKTLKYIMGYTYIIPALVLAIFLVLPILIIKVIFRK